MTTSIVFAGAISGSVGVAALAALAALQADDLDAIEKYGILGLLYIVLVGIGIFLVKVGADMNNSIKANTGAVSSLVTELKLLVQQNAVQASDIQRQMTAHTDRAIQSFRDGLDRVRDELRGERGN